GREPGRVTAGRGPVPPRGVGGVEQFVVEVGGAVGGLEQVPGPVEQRDRDAAVLRGGQRGRYVGQRRGGRRGRGCERRRQRRFGGWRGGHRAASGRPIGRSPAAPRASLRPVGPSRTHGRPSSPTVCASCALYNHGKRWTGLWTTGVLIV